MKCVVLKSELTTDTFKKAANIPKVQLSIFYKRGIFITFSMGKIYIIVHLRNVYVTASKVNIIVHS
jgi:hypothetical protein